MKSLPKVIKKLILFTLLLVLVACTGVQVQVPTPVADTPVVQESHPIVLGDISDDPAEVIEGTQPLADYLADNLQDFGITQGQVRIATTIDEMAQLMADGKVDLYFDSVYPATLVSDASGGQMILRRWRFGVETYQSVIFASVDSGVSTVDDLPGHLIAFDSPYSTSGFLLPAVYLIDQGLILTGKGSYNDPVSGDEVGFVFSYDDENTLQWVLSGFAAAGATDDYNYDVAFPSEVVEKLVVLGRTNYVPRQVVVASADLDPALLDAIIQILLTAHEDEAGQAALEPFQTTRFDEFPEGIEMATHQMREMMDVVGNLPLP